MKEDEQFFEKEGQSLDDNFSSIDKTNTSFLINAINKNRVSFAFLIIGIILIGLGIFYLKFQDAIRSDEVVVLEENNQDEDTQSGIFIEIAGAIEDPGVYEFNQGARVDDLLIKSGGLSATADRNWVEKHVNRASLLSDGQKLYIPKVDEQTDNMTANQGTLYQNDTSVLGGQGSTIVNINTATQSELEELWGIGPVYAQKIIEQRPYSSVEELLEKGVIKSNVYERNKDSMSVY